MSMNTIGLCKMNHKIEYRDQFRSAERASKYDAGYVEQGYASLLYQIEKVYLRESISAFRKTHPQIKLLDFACGTGRITTFIEPLVDQCVGLDISESMLELAKTKTRTTEFICGDLTTDPSICPGPFDLITVFRFVTNAEPQLREAALFCLQAQLRDHHSRLIFNVHRNINSYLFLHRILQKIKPTATEYDWNYLSIKEARQLAHLSGLKIERIIGFGFLSSHIAAHIPYKIALKIEWGLSRVPFINQFGCEFIAVCRSI
jgi:SAM-dependent methyltransferase